MCMRKRTSARTRQVYSQDEDGQWIIRDNQTGKWLGADGSWYHTEDFCEIRVYTAAGKTRWLNEHGTDHTAMIISHAAERYGMWFTTETSS
jgi:hypothetical protein